MKLAFGLCLVVLLGLASAEVDAPKTVMGRIAQQIPFKVTEWISGYLMGMRNKEHYTATL